jgi:hypothetical protein
MVIFIILQGLSGCETFTELGLKNATWELYDMRIDGSTINVMPFRIPDYKENNPAYRYLIHFQGDGKCTGTYYAADTLNYEVEGIWDLPQHDVLRIALDGVVDGDFLITKLERHVFFLSTDKNYHGLALEPPYFAWDMYIKRSY